jgi:hypothetical protein
MCRQVFFVAGSLALLILLSLERGPVRAEQVRLEVTRDTWLSAVGDESKGANGGAARLKLKSIQELSLIDFDFAKLRGKEIQRCRLLLKRAGDIPLDRITLSTLGANWTEGTATNYAIVNGQSTFTHQSYPDVRWADSDITAVSLGAGSTIWRSLKPVKQEADWVAYEVPSELVQLCVAGLSPGWLMMDDTGSTWKRDGETFEHQLFPNRYVFSRDSNRSSMPYLEIECTPNASDQTVPSATHFQRLTRDASSNDSRDLITWRFDKSNATANVVGFRLKVDGKEVDQTFLPSIERSVDEVMTMPIDPRMPPWDLSKGHELELRAVDKMGRESAPIGLVIPAPTARPVALPISSSQNDATLPKPQAVANWSDCLAFANMQVAVIDPLDQLIPTTGQIVPPNRPDYLSENALWHAKTSTIELSTCRSAWVGFQLAIKEPAQGVQLQCTLPDIPGIRIEASRYEVVDSPSGPIADPLIPIGEKDRLEKGVLLEPAKRSPKLGAWLIELYVPAGTPPKEYTGQLELRSGASACSVSLRVNVGSRTIPDKLSFLPEMNCYDLPTNDRDYYRLGQRHRVVVNRVPYYQNGRVAEGLAPKGTGQAWDWSAWDGRFGDLFTGEAFADLPRGKTPIECFYFPMHENWPLPMAGNYNGSYWADEAFPASYRQTFEQTVSDFVEHVESKNWLETRFQVFLNNKVDFKKRGWSRGSSPWLLDEPANFQDYFALRYFGLAFEAGYSRSHRKSTVLYRCDISRPQWERTTLDELLDYNVVSQSAFREYRRLVLDRKLRNGQTVMVYGSSNPIGTSNLQSVAWAWDSWCRGADGILPWQTIGTKQSWEKADELALFYPNPSGPSSPPIPSIRLKAYCYGQQDAERLNGQWRESIPSHRLDRYDWGERFLSVLPLKSISRADSNIAEDAGWSDYGGITPEVFELLRRQLQN